MDSKKTTKAILAALAVTSLFTTVNQTYAADQSQDKAKDTKADATATNTATPDSLYNMVALLDSGKGKAATTAPVAANVKADATTATATADADTQPQTSIQTNKGFYVANGKGTHNSLTGEGLWVGGTDDNTGFHVDNDGNATTTGTLTTSNGNFQVDANGAISTTDIALPPYKGHNSTFVGSGLVNGVVYDTTADSPWAENGSEATGSVAIARGSNVRGTNGLAVGTGASVGNTGTTVANGTALGSATNVTGQNGTAVGEGANVTGDDGTALGYNTKAQKDSTAIGSGASAGYGNAGEAVAIGKNANVQYNQGVAIGNKTATLADQGTALGYNASVSWNGKNSVALGANSIANDEDVVSVGRGAGEGGNISNPAIKRRIINVADGKVATDAATYGQLTAETDARAAADKALADADQKLTDAGIKAGTVNTNGYKTTSNIALGQGASITFSKDYGLDEKGNRLPGVGPWNAVAIGADSRIEDSANAVVIGGGTGGGTSKITNSGNGVSVGVHNTIENSAGGVVIGSNSSLHNAKNSVALGAQSIATEDGVVSVGRQIGDPDSDGDAAKTAISRRIVNVADGIKDSDAATVGQVNKVVTDQEAAGLVFGNITKDSNNLAVGKDSQAYGKENIVFGKGAWAGNGDYTGGTSDQSVIVGAGAQGTGNQVVTIGHGAQSSGGDGNVAIGDLAQARDYKGGAVAIGKNAYATYDYKNKTGQGVAIGSDSFAEGNVVSFGHSADDTNPSDNSKTFGSDLNRRLIHVADGQDATDAVNKGQLDAAKKEFTDAGIVAGVTVKNGIALGQGSVAGANGTAVGTSATAETNGTALGNKAYATEGNAAIGNNAVTKLGITNAVALGTNSIASESNTVSVGAKGNERKVTNVADGVADTDAATVGQVNKADKALNDKFTTYETTGIIGGVTAGKDGIALGKDSGAGANATVVGSGASAVTGGTAFGKGASASGENSAALGTNAVVTGAGKNAVALGAGSYADEENTVSVGGRGVTRKITNVADGTIADGSHDAVTGGQLYKTNQVVKYNYNYISNLDKAGIEGGTITAPQQYSDNNIAIGNGAEITADATDGYAKNNTVLGNDAQVLPGFEKDDKGNTVRSHNVVGSTAIGGEASVSGTGSSAFGAEADAANNDSTSVGYHASSTEQSTAVGSQSQANSNGATALGYYAKANTVNGVAIGSNTTLGYGTDGSVALGANSKVTSSDLLKDKDGNILDKNGVVSVGDSNYGSNNPSYSFQRRIINVADGVNKYDAVNKGQLDAEETARQTADQVFTDKFANYEAAGVVPGKVAKNTRGSIALGGFTTTVAGNYSVAIGTGETHTLDDYGTAIGNNTIAGSHSVAVGSGAGAGHDNSAALGDKAIGMENGTTAIGQHAWAEVENSTALGYNTDVAYGGENSVALGANSQVVKGDIKDSDNGNGVVSVGYSGKGYSGEAFNRRIINVADGIDAHDAVNKGQLDAAQATAKKELTDAGIVAGIAGKDGVAIGANSGAGQDATVVGSGASAVTGAASFGKGAFASGENSVALGTNAVVTGTGKNAVALGAGSYADEANTVSVGGRGVTRKITNVADGVADTDAATVGQVNKADKVFTDKFAAYEAAGIVPGTVSDGDYNLALGENATVTGGNSNTAIGNMANIDGAYNVALGTGASTANGAEDSVAIGYYGQANAKNSVAIGDSATANEDSAVAIGQGSKAVYNATAVGQGSEATAKLSTAIGQSSNAHGEFSTALGAQSDADVNGVAIGYGSVGADRSVAIGNGAKTNGYSSTAIGYGAQASTNGTAVGQAAKTAGQYSTALGQEASATALGATALGSTANATVQGATALGQGTQVTKGTYGTAVGVGATVNSTNGVALGHAAVVNSDSDQGVALGNGASVNAANSVALGADSYADEANTISVGSKDNERKITNVADGVNAHDAVNKGQLDAIDTKVGTLDTNAVKYDGADKGAITFGGEYGTALNNVGDLKFYTSRYANDRMSFKEAGIIPGLKYNADKVGDDNIVIGDEARITGYDKDTAGSVQGSVIIGNGSSTYQATNATAIGGSANVSADKGVALGNGTRVSKNTIDDFTDTQGSVALGAGSQVRESDFIKGDDGIVSVGDSSSLGFQRRIINVADGVKDSDAATVGQVNKADQVFTDKFTAYENAGIKAGKLTSDYYSLALGDGSTVQDGYGTAIGAGAKSVGSQSTAIGASAQTAGSMNSTAVGGTSQANASGATAVGAQSNVSYSSENGSAFGADSHVYAKNGTALGNGSWAFGDDSVALGQGSRTQANETNVVSVGDTSSNLTRRIINVADGVKDSDAATVGQVNKVTKDFAASGIIAGATTNDKNPGNYKIALGTGSVTEAEKGTALGAGAKVLQGASNSVALGTGSVAGWSDVSKDGKLTDPNGVISVGKSGTDGFTRRIVNVADGINATDAATVGQVNAIKTTVNNTVGRNSNDDTSLALGTNSYTAKYWDETTNTSGNSNNTAIGVNARIGVGSSQNSTVLGNNAQIDNGTNATAIGQNAYVGTDRGTAIGQGAKVDFWAGNQGSVALGQGSFVGMYDNVSGDTNGIVSVGKSGTDGFTRRIVNVGAGKNATDAVNVGQFNGSNGSNFLNTVGKFNWKYAADHADKLNKFAEAVVGGKFDSVLNAKTLQTFSNLDVAKISALSLAADVPTSILKDTATTSATQQRDPDAQSTTTGWTQTDTGVKTDGSVDVGKDLTVGGNTTLKGNLDVSGTTTLKDTTINGKATVNGELHVKGTDGKDINVGDSIKANQAAIEQNQKDIFSLGSNVAKLGDEVDSVGAISAALAGLHPLDYSGSASKFQISAALGTYDGTQAAALGGFYNANRNTLLSFGVSTNLNGGDRKTAANIGATFRVGAGNSEPIPSDVDSLRSEVVSLKAENASYKDRLDEMEQQIQELLKANKK